MASKRKTNGVTAVQHVMAAVGKSKVSLWNFFTRAAEKGNGRNVQEELKNFEAFKNIGPSAVSSGYQIPAYVINFADTVHQHPNPQHLFKGA